MATNKTDFLGLNDWIGTDPFKRDEFNANFRALEAKAKEHEDSIGSLSKDANEYEWTSAAGQLTYVLPAGQSYNTTSKWFEVTVGGAPVPLSQIQMDSSTQFTLLVDSAAIPDGVTVVARWTEPSVPATAGHHTKHELGGADEIDITLLKNFNEQVVAPLADRAKYIKPTGSGNDTDLIINSMIGVKKLVFKAGTYYVDITRKILIPSNITLEWEQGAVFQGLTNTSSATSMLNIRDVENVTLINPTIIGDKDTHVSQTSQGCHGIRIGSALAESGQPRAGYTTRNIKIVSPKCSKNMGDGIYINDAENVTVENAFCDTNHRMGIAVISGRNIRLINPKCINSNGVANTVSTGIDIEPNLVTDEIDGLYIDNLYVTNCANQTGLVVSLGNMRGGNCKVNISINNPILEGHAITVINPNGTKGLIEINNPIIKNSPQAGLILRECEYTAAKVRVNNPVIDGWNALQATSTIYSSGITIYADGGAPSGLTNLGNIEIINPSLRSSFVPPYGISIQDAKNNVAPKNIMIVNPLVYSGSASNNFYIPIGDPSIKVKNDLSDPVNFINSAFDLTGVKNTKWYYNRVTATGSGTIITTMNETDIEFEVINFNATTFNLWHDNSTTPTLYGFYPFGSNIKGIQTTQKGASIRFKKTSIGFVATSVSGTWSPIP